jgi:hypothetical protein
MRCAKAAHGVSDQGSHPERTLNVSFVRVRTGRMAGLGLIADQCLTGPSSAFGALDPLEILLQRRDVTIPRDRELVGQIHAIKQRLLPSGKVSFDAERNAKKHADEFWAAALACEWEGQASVPRTGEMGVRVLG